MLLDRLDRTVEISAGGQVDREQTGEPAHGAGQVNVIEQVFAAVAFQFDQRARLLAPATDGARQCGEQQVVDLGAIRGGRLLQQLAGALGVEAPFDFLAMQVVQAAIRAFARQIPGTLMLGFPITQLLIEARRFLRQTRGPALKRACLGRQLNAATRRQLLVSLLQIFQQHPPGNAIDCEVMNDQCQSLRAVGHRHQQRAQQRAVLQVEAALSFVA